MTIKELNIFNANPAAGYSADVQIELLIAGQSFPVGQIGPDVLILKHPTALPACDGQVVLTIDGHPQRWAVTLHPGPEPSRVIKADFQQIS